MVLIEKHVQNIFMEVTTTHQTSILITMDKPGTVMGLLWNFTARTKSPLSEDTLLVWDLHAKSEGTQLTQLQVPTGPGNPQDLYLKGRPREAFATDLMTQTLIDRGVATEHWVEIWSHSRGRTTSKRKLRVGDGIHLSCISNALLGVYITGQVTYWIKY